MIKHIAIASLLLLGACGMFTEERPATKVVDIPKSAPFHPPLPKISLVEIQPWKVYPKGSVVPDTVYAISPRDYETLSLNEAEKNRYIANLLDLLKYYRKPVTPPSTPTQ